MTFDPDRSDGVPRPRLLAIMGSGETAPTMARVHRLLVERLGRAPVDAVLLDTPYGFQENAQQLSQRTAEYFERAVQQHLRVASWCGAADQQERALDHIEHADYVFAGPGSPTYALQVWRGSRLREVLARKLTDGGCVAFSSAAAMTLGLVTVPVYEIYKVGAAPHWLDGMDLLAVIGLRAAVIAHYDNAEGGTHDTRFCYLGERRLRMMEQQLDDETVVLGVDEHTAAVFDLDAGTLSVLGRGAVTVRRQAASTPFGSGATVSLGELRDVAAGGGCPTPSAPGAGAPAPVEPLPSLRSEAQRLEADFDHGLRGGDVDAAVAAILELEQAIVDWSADTEEEDGTDRPRATLRQLVLRLGEVAAVGARDRRERVTPLVEALLELRDRARGRGDWVLADTLRERLAAAGIEVRDTADGSVWLPAEL